MLQLFAVPEQRKGKVIFKRVRFEFHTPVSTSNTHRLLKVQPTRWDVSQFIYFCKSLYMFQAFFPSIIRSSKLHIQRSKLPLTPNPRIPQQQVSSASDCIKTPHRHSHTETERQHTPNQLCGSADTIFWRHSITIRHHVSHTIEIALSNTAIHIKTNNALINNTLKQFLYTSYRYNPWNNNQLVAGSWRWSY